jgi:uncharacterized protein (TIGR02594 family)
LVHGRGGGRGGGAARRTLDDRRQTDLEALDIPTEPTPIEEAPKEPEARLSEGAWRLEGTRFQEEAEVSVRVELPPGKEHLTRIEAELHAKRPSGSELIARGEGHAQADGTAVITLPVYKPNGHQGEPVDYFLVFKHRLAKAFQPESLLRKISETALKSADHALVPGISFPRGRSFITPKAAGALKTLETRFKGWEGKHPKGKVVIFGHANSDEKDPKALSERRAQSAYAFITNDADTWEKLYKAEAWGLIALQTILADLGHYHGKADDKDGPATQAAFKAIQKMSGLTESGREDSATRKAIFAAYMKGKHDIRIDASRFRKVAGHAWMGCSHFNRAMEGEAPAPENRRVAFVLLDESKYFPVHFPCPDGSEGACQGQCKKAGKRSRAGIRCAFYDALVREERQEDAQDEPLAGVKMRHNVPWMQIAEREARKWKGATEAEISKSTNYHKEVGIGLADLVGTDHAWCASFVNYCLKQTGFETSTPPCRARSFLDDPNFIKIDKPVFGAIAVISNHHVCLVYANDRYSSKPIVLGGNQSDQINFTVFHEKITYLLPKEFDQAKYAIPGLEKNSAQELNSDFDIARHKKSGDSTR